MEIKNSYKLFSLIRSLWLLVGVIVLMIFFIEIVASVLLKLGFFFNPITAFIGHDTCIEPGSVVAKRAETPDAYANAQWFPEYRNEARDIFRYIKWDAYNYWKVEPFNKKYININTDKTRKSWSLTKKTKNKINIYFYGGSTTWGWGVRDNYTIPSLVGKHLYQDFGINSNIINYGMLGYVHSQEIVELYKTLRSHKVPDVVVFYDGLNDVFSTYQNGYPGLSQNESNRQEAFNQSDSEKLLNLVLKHSSTFEIIRDIFSKKYTEMKKNQNFPDYIARSTLETYKQNLKFVQSLSAGYGFKPFFYWQPVIFNKPRLTPFEYKMKHFHDYASIYFLEANKLANQIKLPNFYDISNTFENISQPVYIDTWHLSEEGNNMIAARIAKDIARYLSNKQGKSN